MTMKTFRCWSVDSVGKTVYSDIGQLPADADAVFLAAHTPMVISHLRGTELLGANSDEQLVLDALLSGVGDTDRNTLVAVTGHSGAGKSHVVRWVHSQLDATDTRFHVLYVPRAVQTVRELLKRIVVGLPGSGGEEFMRRVDDAVGNSSPGELRDRLLGEIRLALTWTLEIEPPKEAENIEQKSAREERNALLGETDDQGKRRDGLADLLVLPHVNRTMLREGGLLDRFVQSVFEKTSRRDGHQDGFTEDDLPLRDPGMRRAFGGNRALAERWDLIREFPETALSLLDEAVRVALPKALGLTANNGETLDLLFRQARQLLRTQGKELVLLFEDLAQFGLIDGELYDQFVTQPAEDMAPLRVLFAVTDGPYEKLGETIQTRITHRFQVQPTSVTDHETFVGRYLNLVRVGRTGIEDARAKVSGGDQWVPNACDTRENGLPCRVRDECHQAFGAVDIEDLGQVGLYPYNDIALRRAVLGRGDQPTPRAILDVCVRDALIEADRHIGDGSYPHQRVREVFDFTATMLKDAVLDGRTGPEADRLYRAMVIWGNEKPLHPGVAEAFSLSVPGALAGKVAASSKQPPTPQPPRVDTETTTTVSPLHELFQWQNGEWLPDNDATMYRTILFKMVTARIDLSQDLFHTANGIGKDRFQDLFRSYSFVLEDARGSKPGKSSIRIELGRKDASVLMAAKWFADHGHWQPVAGKWPFPDGVSPVDLMLILEQRLDEWAEQVRAEFIRMMDGRGLVHAAIGVRAVALLATGTAPEKLKSINDVVSAAKQKRIPASPVWASVDDLARDALETVRVAEIVGSLAAVRQGDSRNPQLVDVVELDAGLVQFLRQPTKHLRHAGERFHDVDPVLAKAARDLLAAVEKAATPQLAEFRDALGVLKPGLADCKPRAVAKAARDVGRRAMEHGLLRPADCWSNFEEAADRVENIPAGMPLDWQSGGRPDADEALAIQGLARSAIQGARALTVLKDSLAATREECNRNDGSAENIENHGQQVRAKLSQIRNYLDELRVSEASRA